jgi:hypothetical protein
MIRKLIVPCLVALGLFGCHARARVGSVRAGAGVSTPHHP